MDKLDLILQKLESIEKRHGDMLTQLIQMVAVQNAAAQDQKKTNNAFEHNVDVLNKRLFQVESDVSRLKNE